jgi:hypothetical protein
MEIIRGTWLPNCDCTLSRELCLIRRFQRDLENRDGLQLGASHLLMPKASTKLLFLILCSSSNNQAICKEQTYNLQTWQVKVRPPRDRQSGRGPKWRWKKVQQQECKKKVSYSATTRLHTSRY